MQRALQDGEALAPDVAEHVRHCEPCGMAWDRLLAAERALEHTDGLSSRALAVLEARVLASVEPMSPKPGVWRWPGWLVGASAMAAACVALLLVLRPGQPLDFAPRGNGDSGPHPAWVRVLCVGAHGVTAEARSDAPSARLPCGLHDVLAFSVNKEAQAPWRALILVGVTAQGEPRWYHPRPPELQSLALPEAPLADHALGGIRLEVNHAPGVTRVYALFTEQPVTLELVRDAITSRGLDVRTPGDTMVQMVELDLP